MKNFAMMAAALFLGLTLSIGDAEAKRLGGGGSSGMQRQSVAPSKSYESAPQRAPQQQAAPSSANQPAAAPQAQPKRSWLGPIAGLAAGLGLAALASHFGFGEGLANFMMIALLAVAAIALVRFFMAKKAAPPRDSMQYAGAGHMDNSPQRFEVAHPAGGSASNAVSLPAGFDAAAFVRNAKVNFIRLQAANDAGNLDDIREFTSPEMFAEIKLAMDERRGTTQETDVVQLNAEVIDVTEEASRYIVSVHFSGQIREEKNGPVENFAEIWHMTKPVSGGQGWVLAGIQQLQ